jgi:alpha-amylase
MRPPLSPMATAAAALALFACSPAAIPARRDSATVASAAPPGGASVTPAAGGATTVAAKPSADPEFHPAWSRTSVIYEVNVRQYTPEGTLAALHAHLPRLKALGVDILWLMPVQPIGVKNRKGKLGSYYAISDYTAVNPEFGKIEDFRAFVAGAQQMGMKVILDWVANHTAYDHEWVTAHPDYYERRADGSLMNARDNQDKETDWTDVAELDYRIPAMRKAMIDEMKWWLEGTGIDGFRCDVAGGVPVDFWVEARTALKAVHPALFMLAEAEDPQMHAAFDMTYGWDLHHLLNAIAQGKQGTPALDAYFAKDDSLYGAGAYRMYFTSNHDENSWNGSEFERMGANHMPAFILSATAQRSMPLLYTGQEVSLKKRLRFFEKDTVDWHGPSLADFYSAVFALKHRQPALANGPWGGPQVKLATDGGGDRVYAFTRTRDDNTVLVALNFSDKPASVAYRGLTRSGSYTDWFTKQAVALGDDGRIDIAPNGYRVLVR